MTQDFRQDFIRFALERELLRFGEFKTKAGRLSPYSFPVLAIATLDDLQQFINQARLSADIQARIARYRETYGA